MTVLFLTGVGADKLNSDGLVFDGLPGLGLGTRRESSVSWQCCLCAGCHIGLIGFTRRFIQRGSSVSGSVACAQDVIRGPRVFAVHLRMSAQSRHVQRSGQMHCRLKGSNGNAFDLFSVQRVGTCPILSTVFAGWLQLLFFRGCIIIQVHLTSTICRNRKSLPDKSLILCSLRRSCLRVACFPRSGPAHAAVGQV